MVRKQVMRQPTRPSPTLAVARMGHPLPGPCSCANHAGVAVAGLVCSPAITHFRANHNPIGDIMAMQA